jgi:hypothetical protein
VEEERHGTLMVKGFLLLVATDGVVDSARTGTWVASLATRTPIPPKDLALLLSIVTAPLFLSVPSGKQSADPPRTSRRGVA